MVKFLVSASTEPVQLRTELSIFRKDLRFQVTRFGEGLSSARGCSQAVMRAKLCVANVAKWNIPRPSQLVTALLHPPLQNSNSLWTSLRHFGKETTIPQLRCPWEVGSPVIRCASCRLRREYITRVSIATRLPTKRLHFMMLNYQVSFPNHLHGRNM